MKRAITVCVLLVFTISLLGPAAFASGKKAPAAKSSTAGKVVVAKQETREPVLYAGAKSEIDATNNIDGYFSVRYLEESSKRLKIKVIKLNSDDTEGAAYIYDLNSKGNPEIFSYTMGDGKYLIKVLENIEGDRYAIVQSQTISVKMGSSYAPFLIPIQLINYSSSSKVVVKAAELTKSCKTDLDKVQTIYQYIIKNITYDYDKANKVIKGELNGYVPVVDTILNSKKGICFDYSSLMGAMLRSQGIPTRLIMGYVAPNNAYHAWNEVYIKGQGWIKINSSVYFDGKNWSRMDSTFAAANNSGKQTQFIGNGKNYSPIYQY